MRGRWDGLGSFLAGFLLLLFWGVVWLFGLNGCSLFPAGAVPRGGGGCVCVLGELGNQRTFVLVALAVKCKCVCALQA